MVIVDCKGNEKISGTLKETMRSFLKRNHPTVNYTLVKQTATNDLSFPDELLFHKAFQESSEKLHTKFTLRAA
jgi:hypothetical protein